MHHGSTRRSAVGSCYDGFGGAMADEPASRVLQRYERLLEPPEKSRSRVRRDAAVAARACFEAMKHRFPGTDAIYVIDLLIQLGAVGSFDMLGSLRAIAKQIADLLGTAPEPGRLYRGIRALAGKTCVAERVSRQIWCLRLAGVSDPGSEHHRRLLAETPSPYFLGGRTTDATELRRQLAAAEEAALVSQAEAAELRRMVEQEKARLGEASRLAAAERVNLEDLLLEREIAVEDLGHLLAAQRAEQEANSRTGDLGSPVTDASRVVALRTTLKRERERRYDAEKRLRRILGILRVKLAEQSAEPSDELDLEDVEAIMGELSEVWQQHLDALRHEHEELSQTPEQDPARLADLNEDVRVAESLTPYLAIPPGGGRRR